MNFSLRASIVALFGLASLPAHAIQAGDRAVDFNLRDLSGRSVKLSALRGKVVVVDFWASWCVPCKKELPALDGLARRYNAAKKDVVILVINIDKERAKAERFLASAKVTSCRVLLDPDGGAASRYELPTMPTSYVIDKKGIVRFVHSGYTAGDEHKVAKEVEELLTK